MSAVSVVVDLADQRGRSGWTQPLAGGTLWTSFPLGVAARSDEPPRKEPEPSIHGPWRRVYEGPGEAARGPERITVWIADDGRRRLDFEDGESLLIGTGGRRIVRGGSSARGGPSTESRALAAPLTLALAAQGVFLLHASAVAGRSGVIALAATSGTGKSTLAEAAAAAGLLRIADDQLPVRLEAEPVALPHFPQLKLAPGDGYPADAPAIVRLAALVVLQPDPEAGSVKVEKCGERDATVALVRAGTGLRLFEPPLLAAHFEAAAAAGRSLPVFTLRYPRRLDRLADAVMALAGIDRGLA